MNWLSGVSGTQAQNLIASEPTGLSVESLLAGSDTFVGIPFTRAPEFIGLVTSATGNVITVDQRANWSPNQFVYAASVQRKHYFVLIGRAAAGVVNPKEGHFYQISANTANSLTVDTTRDDLTGLPANAQVSVIPYWTPGTIFPPSNQNISFTPTTSSSVLKTTIRVADYALSRIDSALAGLPLTNPSGGGGGSGVETPNLPYLPAYFFSNNVDGTTSNVGWRRVGDNLTDHGDDALFPAGHVVIRNDNGASTLPLTAVGTLLGKRLTVPLLTASGQQQDNPVSLVRPFDVALKATGLNPADGSFVAGDQLLVFDNLRAGFDKVQNNSYYTTYYYSTQVGSTGWRRNGDPSSDRGNETIPAGAGFIVRKGATSSGQTVFWTNSMPVAPLRLVSRKSHGGRDFDVELPLTGEPGVECRSGQGNASDQHTLVVTFPTNVTVTGGVITSGTGNIASVAGSGTSVITIVLGGVTNAQRLTLTLLNVSDGLNTNDVAVRVSVLGADTTNDGFTNSSDINYVKSKTGTTVTQSNFRADLTADGNINSTDIAYVKSKSGTALP